MTRTTDVERTETVERLRRMLPPGSTVSTVTRHTSRSGMSRSISLIISTDDGPLDISGMAARVMGDRFDRNNGGVIMGGCGMDMGFAAVYGLSRTLYADSFHCIGRGKDVNGRTVGRCPSNDHVNDRPAWNAYRNADRLRALEDIAAQRFAGERELTDAEAEELRTLKAAKRAEAKLWSKSRMHSDGGYALRQRWL